MEIRVYGTASDSIVDGPGLRYAVFVQGCPHHCPGCHNPKSHPFEGGKLLDTEELTRRMAENPLLDGLTLSGGEPMCQPLPCRALADWAHGQGMNVWCYTGYTFEQLLAEGDPARLSLLEAVDVLVDGPFLLDRRSLALMYRGSDNQRLIDVPASMRRGTVTLWTPPAW